MTEPNYPMELLDATRLAFHEAGIDSDPHDDSPTDFGYPEVTDFLDALRAEGWIVQPAPVPGVPVNVLPDGPPAPGAPADPGAAVDTGEGVALPDWWGRP